ncbi:MAG: putative rane protein [Actinomycetota bacterium]|nr:putative rane protein [Actinomycetota bacterium]
MSLAAERTYLAYVRTALAFLAGGVAVAGALPDAGHSGLRRVIGVVLVLIGSFVAITAGRRFSLVTTAMRRGDPLPAHVAPLVVTVGTVAAALLAIVLVLLF